MKFVILIVSFLLCFIDSAFPWNIKPLDNKSKRPRVNIVFCSLNYPGKKEVGQDIAVIFERLKRTRPFDQSMDTLGFWQLSLNRREEWDFFRPAEGMPPLKVVRALLEGISTKLGGEYKLIIIDAKGSSSCAELSSIDKMSLVILGRARYGNPDSFAKGFLHELGHSFGLRDECVDCGQLCPPGPPNCAGSRKEAEELWGDMVGKVERVNYINGCCGSTAYIRPVIASLMNNTEKAEDFGPVNERFLGRELRRQP